MLYKNSYIFLRRENEPELKKKDKDTYELRLESSFVNLFKKCFEEITYNNKMDHHATMNSGQFKIIYKERNRIVYFKYYNVGKNYYLDIIVDSKSEYDAINILDIVNTTIMDKKNAFEKYYLSIISYDYISEYYCNKLYPYLNKFDRKVRKLLLNIYTLNFNHKYYLATTTETLKKDIKGRIGSWGIKNVPSEDARIKYAFYSLEYNNIDELLFTKTVTESEKKNVEEFLENNEDLSKVEDSDIREMFNVCQGKTDWERFLGDKGFEEDFQSTLNDIRKYRNGIAHCRFISRDQYNTCLGLIRKTTKTVDKAIRITERKDFTLKNIELHEESFRNVTKALHKMIEIIMQPLRDTWMKNISEFKATWMSKLPDIELPKYNLEDSDEKNKDSNSEV